MRVRFREGRGIHTLRQVLLLSKTLLEEHNVREPRQTAESILAEVLNLTRVELYLYFDRPILNKEWRSCQELLKRKIAGEPIEHLMRVIDFFKCRIEVTPKALIPRQETEILIQKACDFIRDFPKRDLVAWDLCCGTGCLGLGLKKFFPYIQVALSDLSDECVRLSLKNAASNGLDVEVLQGDLLKPFATKKADIILCNPPYISEEEYWELDRGVRDFEPQMALVGGVKGTEFYERLADELPSYLNEGAWVFLEIGYNQGADLMKVFRAPCWIERHLSKDWAGHDRFLFMRYKKEGLCSEQ